MTVRSVLIEADGGSRGNPGPAAYGAVLMDAETGAVIAEDGTTIGIASNNVAEYSGLIAGLKMAAEFAPEADIHVRMDSKLVVEQMSGRWKIKHPDMRPLATEANRLAPFGTTYEWIPRELNSHADRLANEALDGVRSGVTLAGVEELDQLVEAEDAVEELPVFRPHEATTLILVRHGVTAHTTGKRFSGGLKSTNPGLSEEGRGQVRATAAWLAPLADDVATVIASPVRRTRESADIVAAHLGLSIEEEPGFAEMEFGDWDGLTFKEVAERHRADLDAWIGSLDVKPGRTGESFHTVQKRVLAGRQRLLAKHRGKTVIVVSHVTPIKVLVADALQAPLDAAFRMELTPASVTVLSYLGADDRPSLRSFNTMAPGTDDLLGTATRW